MYAIRCARAYTERKAIVKIEGGYHGGYDALQVSVKPGLDEIGPADAPTPQVPFDVEAGTVHVIAYNDLEQLDRVLAEHGSEIAALVVEPVIENLSIVVPDEGYLAGVRAACDAHGVVLIFDEVKTGPHRRLRRCRPAARRHPRPHHPRQVDRRRPAARRRSVASARSWRSSSTAGWRTSAPTTATRSSWRPPGRRRDLHPRGPRRGRGGQRARPAGHRRHHRRVRAAGPHRRARGQGLRHLVDDPGAQLPRLQGHRLRPGGAVLAVGRQPAHPDPARASTSSGWSRWCTTDADMATLVDDFRELAQALRA